MYILKYNTIKIMSDININKLKKQEKERRKIREKCFDNIKNMALKKIELVAKTGLTNCVLFRVPMFILGEPSYDIKQCTNYLIKKLEKRGFKAILFQEIDLLIYWNLDDE